MQNKINLLPSEFVVKENVKAAGVVLKKIAMAGAVFFVILSCLGSAYMFFLSRQIQERKSEVQNVMNNIKNSEPTEQKLFLTRDRIAKVKLIYAKSGVEESVNRFKDLVNIIPQEVVFAEGRLSPEQNTLGFSSGDSLTMLNFLNRVALSGIYTSISINSFDFLQSMGYQMKLGIY